MRAGLAAVAEPHIAVVGSNDAAGDWPTTQNSLGSALAAPGVRANGTARLDKAVAAIDACLTAITSVWPPEWVSWMRARQDETRAEIGWRMAK